MPHHLGRKTLPPGVPVPRRTGGAVPLGLFARAQGAAVPNPVIMMGSRGVDLVSVSVSDAKAPTATTPSELVSELIRHGAARPIDRDTGAGDHPCR